MRRRLRDAHILAWALWHTRPMHASGYVGLPNGGVSCGCGSIAPPPWRGTIRP